MEITAKSEIKLIELLYSLGIPAEAVLLEINGKLVPETAIAKKGETISIIFYKHVPIFSSPSEPRGHWSRAKPKSTCDKCKSKPVIYLPYAKAHLCKKHFSELFEKRVKRTIRDYKMLKKGDKVGIGLSGGKDSYALLYALVRVQDSLPFELVALTIDEGIPGYRDKAIENAQNRCRELGIIQHVYLFSEEYGKTISQIAKAGKENLCSYCGVLRRKILNSKARELGLNKIAIGHNLDDVAQTAMLNLIRNEPMRFARFNDPIENEMFVARIRPLRDIREKEVAAYALLHGHKYNSGCCCPNATGALRWSVRHELNSLEDQYPGTKSKIASSFNTLQEIVKKEVSDKGVGLYACKECGEPASEEICMSCKMLSDL